MTIEPLEPRRDDAVPRRVQLAFAPLHKRAFGTAVGVAAGSLVFLATAVTLLFVPGDPGLHLLGQYFYGYTVSWEGAFVGLFWGGFSGFVAGWFAAFCRNLALAALIFVARTRAELEATRDFLDHI
jgi:hypothetical protein